MAVAKIFFHVYDIFGVVCDEKNFRSGGGSKSASFKSEKSFFSDFGFSGHFLKIFDFSPSWVPRSIGGRPKKSNWCESYVEKFSLSNAPIFDL